MSATYPAIIVEGTCHALRHLPWMSKDEREEFHRLAALHLTSVPTMEAAEAALCYFAIQSRHFIPLGVDAVWAFFRKVNK